MGRFHLFQPCVVEMELSLLLLEALDEWAVSSLLVLAITVHEVATTLCYPSYSSFERVTDSLCESDCLRHVVLFVVEVATSSNFETYRNRLPALLSQLVSQFTVFLVLTVMSFAHVFFPWRGELNPGHCPQLV